MALDPLLLEILACPEDQGPLLYFEDEDALYNPRLHRRYAIRDGIPIMLIDEAETVDDAEHERLMAKVASRGSAADVPSRERCTPRRRAHPTATSMWETTVALARAGRPRARRPRRRWPPPGCPTATGSPRGRPRHGRQRHRPRRARRHRRAVRPVPVVVVKDYELPAFVGPSTLVVAVSFSGNTEETVGADRGRPRRRAAALVVVAGGGRLAELARSAGAPVVPVPHDIPHPAGGDRRRWPSPRWWCSRRMGLLPGASAQIDAAVRPARRPARSARRPATAGRRRLARRIGRTIPLVYGGGALGPGGGAAVEVPGQREPQVAGLRVGQPELCHNELTGWGQLGDVTRQLFTLVDLRHDFEHPQVARRFALVDEIMDEVVAGDRHGAGRGRRAAGPAVRPGADRRLRGPHLAAQEGIDPGPIPVLEELKAALARLT